MAPIVSEKAEEDANVAKLLCQMDNHLGVTYFIVQLLRHYTNWYFIFQHVSIVFVGPILDNT